MIFRLSMLVKQELVVNTLFFEVEILIGPIKTENKSTEVGLKNWGPVNWIRA